MEIMITNDDGYSEGMKMLLEAGRQFGDAYAVVPNRQRSAVSGALTLHKPIRIHKIEEDIYTINGTPADCVVFSLYSGEFKKPDLILSGINWGDNTGISPLISSGTIGACWQAAHYDVPAIAFSMDVKTRHWKDKSSWGNSGSIVKTVTDIITKLKPKLVKNKFFSVNLPDDLTNSKIIFTNKLQKRRHSVDIVKKEDPYGHPYYWVGGISKRDNGSDYYEVNVNKNITISEFSLDRFIET
ncbi:5'/3'-nucleotidase SurE [Candidatus Micrarchaeota archaeon]|nr:5'/3'-nucleotidase SurE [Candidatus Micrarchaeota archaeon]MBU1165749.1 5'/3'-nucleotidase SurE [Candidatus Micrarchaeota archaeon]MBU1887502.1 5'/3'-nucleotidase SurE [Candidatus Micrarchaeota archaeon]